jgi:hypothetical protein
MTIYEQTIKDMTPKEFAVFNRWMTMQRMFTTYQEGLAWWLLLKKQAKAAEAKPISDTQIN